MCKAYPSAKTRERRTFIAAPWFSTCVLELGVRARCRAIAARIIQCKPDSGLGLRQSRPISEGGGNRLFGTPDLYHRSPDSGTPTCK